MAGRRVSAAVAGQTRKARVWLGIGARLLAGADRLRNHRACTFLSDRQTLGWLRDSGKGIARFGDGEAGFLAGYGFPHQRQHPELRARLRHILAEYDTRSPALVALPHDLVFGRNFAGRRTAPRFWNAARYALWPYLRRGATYGSAFCFRLGHVIDPDPDDYRARLLALLAGRDLVFVGGDESYRGVVAPRAVVTVPREHAFDAYAEIRAETLEAAGRWPAPLVLLSCGITATALAWDLSHQGLVAYDVGLLFSRRLRQELARAQAAAGGSGPAGEA